MRHKTRIVASPKVLASAGSIFHDIALTLLRAPSTPPQRRTPQNFLALASFLVTQQRCQGEGRPDPSTVKAAIQQSPLTIVLDFTSEFPNSNYKISE